MTTNQLIPWTGQHRVITGLGWLVIPVPGFPKAGQEPVFSTIPEVAFGFSKHHAQQQVNLLAWHYGIAGSKIHNKRSFDRQTRNNQIMDYA